MGRLYRKPTLILKGLCEVIKWFLVYKKYNSYGKIIAHFDNLVNFY